MLDFRRLQVFVAVMREGNFSKAATLLYLTQPTISAHIDNLEQELGIALFERGSRRAEPTEAAKKFYPYAVDLLEMKEMGISSINKFKSKLEGEVTIFSSSTPGIYLLPHRISSFLKGHPGVTITISIKNSYEAAQGILDYRAHLAFVGTKFRKRSLTYISIGQDTLVALLPKNQFLHLQEEVALEDLLELPFIIRSEGSGTRRTLALALKEVGVDSRDLKTVVTIDSLEGIGSAVAAGLGVSVMSSFCQVEGVRKAKIVGLNLKRDFYLVYHQKRALPPIVEKMVESIKEVSSSCGGGDTPAL